MLFGVVQQRICHLLVGTFALSTHVNTCTYTHTHTLPRLMHISLQMTWGLAWGLHWGGWSSRVFESLGKPYHRTAARPDCHGREINLSGEAKIFDAKAPFFSCFRSWLACASFVGDSHKRTKRPSGWNPNCQMDACLNTVDTNQNQWGQNDVSCISPLFYWTFSPMS